MLGSHHAGSCTTTRQALENLKGFFKQVEFLAEASSGFDSLITQVWLILKDAGGTLHIRIRKLVEMLKLPPGFAEMIIADKLHAGFNATGAFKLTVIPRMGLQSFFPHPSRLF